MSRWAPVAQGPALSDASWELPEAAEAAEATEDTGAAGGRICQQKCATLCYNSLHSKPRFAEDDLFCFTNETPTTWGIYIFCWVTEANP